MTADDAGLDRLNGLSDDEAGASLRAACASSAWVASLVAARPYASRSALLDHSAEVLGKLDWADILEALAAHPRIGERMAGTGREAAWSAREQSGAANSTDAVRDGLIAANRAYEDRFGHVFLIFATGKTDASMLAAAQSRLTNDEETERAVVRSELGRIVALRLTRLLDEAP
jgi:2-oxo-4-hydroxy-4-carboxy-5-ureidoimidazoline decarboxylase